MHIAWLGKKKPVCGNAVYGQEITTALSEREHRISFFHFASENETDGEEEAIHLPYLYRSTMYTVPSLRARKVLTDALRQLQPDLVHASLPLSPLDFALPEICQELGLPLVATFHAPFDAKRRNLTASTQQFTYQLYAPALAEYDRVVIFSEQQKAFLNRLGVPANRIAVIPNGVDPERYAPGPSDFKAECQAQVLFVYQGRLAPEKNVEALLRAWYQAEMPAGCKLALVGGGPLEATLKLAYSSDPDVLWLGFVGSSARRLEILRAADVFVLPSLVEGLSLSLLEAMACGVACMATDVGADGEALAGAGLVLDPHEATAQLRTLMPVLATYPEIAQLLGRKARQRVLERYTLRQNIATLEQLYAAITGARQVALPVL